MSELRTDVLKDGAGTGSPSFPNGLAQADIANAVNAAGSAPIFGCRAWVNFDGTRNVDDTGVSTNGQPVLIKASGNVTSVVKDGTGNFTINFATAMEDTAYAVNVTSAIPAGNTSTIYLGVEEAGSKTTSSVGVLAKLTTTTGGFDTDMNVTIFR